MYEYRVVPFIGQVKEGEKDKARAVVGQLEAVINEQAANGWEYVSIDRVQIAVRPGCATLGAARAGPVGFDLAVFRRAK